MNVFIDCFKECLRRPRLFIFLRIGMPQEQTTPALFNWWQRGFPERRPLVSFTMTDSQHVTLGPITFVDKKGNPGTQPTGSTIQWLVDQPTVLALTPSADTLSCDASAVGPLGTATISVKAVDAGGTTLASGSVDCTIIGGAPVVITVPVGTPAEQP